MKKKNLVVAGLIATASAIAPVTGAWATGGTTGGTATDTIKITITDACTFAYDTTSTSHVAGTGDYAGTWSGNELSANIINGTAVQNLGSTNFKVVCNAQSGYSVVFVATDLGMTGNTNKIVYSNSAPASSASTWTARLGDSTSTTFLTNNAIFQHKSTATASDTFKVTYGASVDSSQEAGTYTGTAVYTMTYPDQSS